MKVAFALLLCMAAWCPAPLAGTPALGLCRTDVGWLQQYDERVEEAVDRLAGKGGQLSIAKEPPFSPETGLRFVGNEVVLVRFESSLWQYGIVVDGHGTSHMDFSKGHNIRAIVHRAPIDPSLVLRIENFFSKAILGAKITIGAEPDATRYRFFVSGIGCAEMWTPEPDSTAGRIAALIELLAKHATLSDTRAIKESQSAILYALTDLEKEQQGQSKFARK